MKCSMLTKLLSALSVSALLCLGVLRAEPSDSTKKTPDDGKPKTQIKHDLGKVELHPDHVKIHRRAAIAHRPLEVVDLKTGQKISPDKMMDLSNGKKVKAGEYFTELNKLEKKFNDMGYSLREAKVGRTLLQQNIIDENEHNEQAKKLHAGHLAFDAQSMRAPQSPTALDQKYQAALSTDAQRIKSVADATASNAPAKTMRAVKQWNYVLGNKKLVAAYLNGKVEVTGNKDNVTISGDARAGGYIINKEINLIKATGSVSAPAQGQSRANLHVYLLGQHVINLDKSGNASLKFGDTKSHGIDVHADFHFSIGPVPMVAKVGARGNAGVRYLFAVRPAHATMEVVPFVDARVYAQVGVDLFLASGGAGGEVILLKDELTFGAELGVEFNSTSGPVLTQHLYAQNKMTMLSGKLYAWARVNYLFGSHEWHYDLFSWKGIQASGYLFNINNSTPLVPNYQAVAQKS